MLGVAVTVVRYSGSFLPGLVGGLALALSALATVAVMFPRLEDWLPEHRRQVRGELLFVHSARGAALRWGFQLGLGFITRIVTPGFLALMAVALIQPAPLRTLTVCVAYGVVRGSVLAGFALSKARRERLRAPIGLLDGPLKKMLRIPVGVASVLVVWLSLGREVFG